MVDVETDPPRYLRRFVQHRLATLVVVGAGQEPAKLHE